ncbi:putative secreted protein [Streptomyces davaonensis JCM 4913]|uniref:Putative secreted protein n=2 Tax=Streptomyces davaonensis TaxID=348043 RepID=K4R1R4_STRDJ|nr:putative secreted protein [Streptomyces davaonensis JCM 4913]
MTMRTARTHRRATALGLAALFTAAALATTTACGSSEDASPKSDSGDKKKSAASGQALENKAYGYNPYAWATRRDSRIGVYGIELHGQSFTLGGEVKLVLYKDNRVPGVPSWYRTTTARWKTGRHGGAFDVTTGMLDCTAYGYAKDSTLMALDVTTNTWSNKVRVSTGCSR